MTFEELVNQEREYQKAKWGASDPANSVYHWGAYINAYTARSLIGFPGFSSERNEAFKKDMIKVAALAKAAYESI